MTKQYDRRDTAIYLTSTSGPMLQNHKFEIIKDVEVPTIRPGMVIARTSKLHNEKNWHPIAVFRVNDRVFLNGYKQACIWEPDEYLFQVEGQGQHEPEEYQVVGDVFATPSETSRTQHCIGSTEEIYLVRPDSKLARLLEERRDAVTDDEREHKVLETICQAIPGNQRFVDIIEQANQYLSEENNEGYTAELLKL